MRSGFTLRYTALTTLAGLVSVMACSSSPPAGLEVVITTNLVLPTDYDAIRVEVSQQNAEGSWLKLLDTSYAIPKDVTLPSTLAIAPGPSPDQDALIKVTAYRGFQGDGNPGTVRVVREAQLQIPVTRIAELNLELSTLCIDVSCTNPDQSCQPSGKCGSNDIDSSTLPTYTGPGEGGAVCEGQECDAASPDARPHDAGGEGGSHDEDGGGHDAGPATGHDAGKDTGGNVPEGGGGTDATMDGGSPSDGGVDSSPDTGGPRDASGEGSHDAGADAPHDTGTDAPHDSGVDATHDSGSDGPPRPIMDGTLPGPGAGENPAPP